MLEHAPSDGRIHDPNIAMEVAYAVKGLEDFYRGFPTNSPNDDPLADINRAHPALSGAFRTPTDLDAYGVRKMVTGMAELLATQPVSDAYKQEHADIEFNPHTLAIQNEWAELDLAETEYFEAAVDKLSAFHLIEDGVTAEDYDRMINDFNGLGVIHWQGDELLNDKGGIDVETSLTLAYGPEPKGIDQNPEGTVVIIDEASTHETIESTQAWHEYRKLTNSPDTTRGAYKNFFMKVFRKAYIEPVEIRANTVFTVVDDIRSGRAAETQGE